MSASRRPGRPCGASGGRGIVRAEHSSADRSAPGDRCALFRRATRSRSTHHRVAVVDHRTLGTGRRRTGARAAPRGGLAAATTGASNLVAAVVCTTADDLYTYLTDRIPSLPGLHHVETVPVITQVKQRIP
ncbi:hypothetical protein [Nocardia miyunensis]|uniref:hypothetical protein n=1 Tax=Nocardia miyunensis TaxID=282684 RepID=UPI003F75EC6A